MALGSLGIKRPEQKSDHLAPRSEIREALRMSYTTFLAIHGAVHS
jgi:hypothetical protein